MITVLTALRDLVHSGQFSAQRHRGEKGKKEENEQKNWKKGEN